MTEEELQEKFEKIVNSIINPAPLSTGDKKRLYGQLKEHLNSTEDHDAFSRAQDKAYPNLDDRMNGWFWGFKDCILISKGIDC